MRSDHPHRRSISHAYHQSIGSRLVRDLGWPRRQIAGQPQFRRVCKDYDFVSKQSTYLRLHRRSESLHAFPVEQFHQPLHILPMNIFPKSREICVPRIPERNREQGEHENAECDVGKCQPERGKGEELDHMCWYSVVVESALARVNLQLPGGMRLYVTDGTSFITFVSVVG